MVGYLRARSWDFRRKQAEVKCRVRYTGSPTGILGGEGEHEPSGVYGPDCVKVSAKIRYVCGAGCCWREYLAAVDTGELLCIILRGRNPNGV